MALLEFDRHDHPEANQFLPQVGCAICLRAVQPAGIAVEHWDELPAEQQQALLEEMAAWSRDHSSTHGEAEHEAHQDRLTEASR